MSVFGTCEICKGDTKDYECLSCVRVSRNVLLATLKRAVQEDFESKRPEHHTRMRYAYDVIAKAESGR